MTSPVERGTLMIADIGGFTSYVGQVELEHSHDIIANLLDTIIEATSGLFQVSQLEGDAVFVRASGDVSASALISAIDSCYLAFSDHIRNIQRNTVCRCGACRLIPALSLKFVVHYGSYIRSGMRGMEQLVGNDVIVVHRLLKNTVTAQTGLHGYALVSEACIESLRLDPDALRMKSVEEKYDLGPIRGYALDLEERLEHRRKATVVRVDPEEAEVTVERAVPGTPAVVWDAVTAPGARTRWMPGLSQVEQESPTGVAGTGTINHCVHRRRALVEEIVDWRPFDYMTIAMKKPLRLLITYDLAPAGTDTTKVAIALAPHGGVKDRVAIKLMRKSFRAEFEDALRGLSSYLEEQERPTGSGRAPAHE